VHELAGRLLKTIRKQDLIRPGDRVAAAVSGGADSVALLCLLLELRAELGIVLSVAHVNHKLRGEESEGDARFVAKLAEEHRLELHACVAAVESSGSGIEAAARELRYRFFRQLAREGTVAKIATAHTLDDQAETVLLRIFRGTGIRGLSGIHPRMVIEERGEVVRPLLGFRHAALLEFLRERGQSWREDSSNLDVAFLRNRVRHRLLPIISSEFGEAALEHMSELTEIARAEEEHWTGHPEVVPPSAAKAGPERPIIAAVNCCATQKHFQIAETRQAASLPMAQLLKLSLAAQRRLVRAWLEMNAAEVQISFRLIEEVLALAHATTSKELELPGGWRLVRERQELVLEPAGSGDVVDYEYRLAVPGTVFLPELGGRIEARVVDAGNVPEAEHAQLLDLERVPKEVVVRNWRPGDRFWPAHTAAEKKVKELLGDRHVTGAERKLWPVVVAEGGIVWMRGFAVPAALRVPAGAPRAIWIREIAGMM
jgi:tRNA(Ile)-lysidine synthase